jgi:CBS domain-containing protein
MFVRDVMTPDPVTVHPEATVHDMRQLMVDLGARHLPVVEGELLLGIVSTSDLSRRGSRVADIMSTELFTCGPEERIDVVAARMAAHRVRGMPVLEGHRLVGIVTTFDLLDAMIRWIRSMGALPPTESGPRHLRAVTGG